MLCYVLHRLFDGLGVDARFHSGRGGAGADRHSRNRLRGQGPARERNLAAKINTDATAIKTLAADFAKVSSGSAPGVCQKLQAAVSAYQADQQLVLQVAQVSDPNTQTKITLLADLVAGTVNAITAVIPSCQNADYEASSPHRPTASPPSRLITTAFLWRKLATRPWMRRPKTEAPSAVEIRAVGDFRTAPVTTPNRKFGALRDVHDVRDRMYRASPRRGQFRNMWI